MEGAESIVLQAVLKATKLLLGTNKLDLSADLSASDRLSVEMEKVNQLIGASPW